MVYLVIYVVSEINKISFFSFENKFICDVNLGGKRVSSFPKSLFCKPFLPYDCTIEYFKHANDIVRYIFIKKNCPFLEIFLKTSFLIPNVHG